MNQQEFLLDLQEKVGIQKRRLKYQKELKIQAESLFKKGLDKEYEPIIKSTIDKIQGYQNKISKIKENLL